MRTRPTDEELMRQAREFVDRTCPDASPAERERAAERVFKTTRRTLDAHDQATRKGRGDYARG